MQPTLNIQGFIAGIDLEPDEYLLPLHEVIINSIQSIEDKTDGEKGQISIKVVRGKQGSLLGNFDKPYKSIEGFEVCDNGVGFVKERFQAFNDAFTEINKRKGCKGIGRYTVLACMGSMEVNSTFKEKGKWLNRTFRFDSKHGIFPGNDENIQPVKDSRLVTVVKLNNYHKKFQEYINNKRIEVADIAESIIQHCLLYFISNEIPLLRIFNDNEPDRILTINDQYRSVVKFDNEVKAININGIKKPFQLNYIRNYNNKVHSFHLCANKREVGKRTSISNYIPSFVHSLADGNLKKYFLSVYVTGEFLDEKANNQRNKFSIPPKMDEKNTYDEICMDELMIALSNNVREQYSKSIISAEKEKNERIQKYILDPQKPRLSYRHLLTVENVFEDIPANATDERLEAELHKKVFTLEQKRSKAFERAFAKKKYDKEEFGKIIHEVLREESAFSSGKLADLMIRRKAIIKLFGKYLEWRTDENYMLEEDLHNIIFTMGAETDKMPCDYHNLWLLDERLTYHSRTTSDRQIRSNKHIASDSQKETDLMIYDFPWAYTDNPKSINSLVIFEFKRPGRDMMQNSKDRKLDEQVVNYFEKLMESKAKSSKGEFLRINDTTPKFGYVICELHNELIEYNRKHNGFKPTPYGTLYKINPEINQYIEVMTYQTMLDFAEKRHDAFFKALGIDNL